MGVLVEPVGAQKNMQFNDQVLNQQTNPSYRVRHKDTNTDLRKELRTDREASFETSFTGRTWTETRIPQNMSWLFGEVYDGRLILFVALLKIREIRLVFTNNALQKNE